MEKLAGIPGTISPEAARIRWIRKTDFPADPVYRTGLQRVYEAAVADGALRALVSQDPAGKDGRLLWHLSVSHRDRDGRPDRCPTWDELKHALYRLLHEVDRPFQLIFPRKNVPVAVDVAPTCLHLWECEEDVDL